MFFTKLVALSKTVSHGRFILETELVCRCGNTVRAVVYMQRIAAFALFSQKLSVLFAE